LKAFISSFPRSAKNASASSGRIFDPGQYPSEASAVFCYLVYQPLKGAHMRIVRTIMAACLALSIAAPATIATANDAHHPQASKQTKTKKVKPTKKAPKRSEAPHSPSIKGGMS